MVLPNMASIADIKAISYNVCGVVRIAGTDLKAKVMFLISIETSRYTDKRILDGFFLSFYGNVLTLIVFS